MDMYIEGSRSSLIYLKIHVIQKFVYLLFNKNKRKVIFLKIINSN